MLVFGLNQFGQQLKRRKVRRQKFKFKKKIAKTFNKKRYIIMFDQTF